MNERYFIIVEGYMDLISLHQQGITNVVASLGTALTHEQARLLRRYADKVIISYDADVAGQTATLRGLNILREVGFDVRVLNIPNGKDPDEFVRNNGKEAFLELVKNAENLIDYRIRKAGEGLNLDDNTDLVKYGKKVTEILADVNPLEKDIYIKNISEKTGIREQTLFDLLTKEMTKNINKNNFMNNKEENGTKLYVEPPFLKAERALLKLSLEDEYFEEIENLIKIEDFIVPEHIEIFSIIKEAKKGKINNIVGYLETRFTDAKILEEIVKIKEEKILIGNNNKKLIRDLIKQIINYKLNKDLETLKSKQRIFEKQGKIEETIRIAMEINKINEQLKKGVN